MIKKFSAVTAVTFRSDGGQQSPPRAQSSARCFMQHSIDVVFSTHRIPRKCLERNALLFDSRPTSRFSVDSAVEIFNGARIFVIGGGELGHPNHNAESHCPNKT